MCACDLVCVAHVSTKLCMFVFVCARACDHVHECEYKVVYVCVFVRVRVIMCMNVSTRLCMLVCLCACVWSCA